MTKMPYIPGQGKFKALPEPSDREARKQWGIPAKKKPKQKPIMQGSKEHLASLKGMLKKAKPGSVDHSQIRHAIESMFGKEHLKEGVMSFREYLDEAKGGWLKKARAARKAIDALPPNHPDRKKHLADLHYAMAQHTKDGIDDGKLSDEHMNAARHYGLKESKAAELRKGRKREMEHTDDPKVAEKIARDHVRERPDYYSKLDKCMPEEDIHEGWHRHKDGSWSADASEIEHHLKTRSVRCPHCRKDLSFKDFKAHKDREGEVTHATHRHSCGHHLTVFND